MANELPKELIRIPMPEQVRSSIYMEMKRSGIADTDFTLPNNVNKMPDHIAFEINFDPKLKGNSALMNGLARLAAHGMKAFPLFNRPIKAADVHVLCEKFLKIASS